MNEHARQIGARLRSVRTQRRLSLAQVERRSGGTWKAVVVGAYERGDRSVTLSRLAGLAAFYGVPLADLLPEQVRPRVADPARPPVRLDLTREHSDDPQLQAVERFASRIRRKRGDAGGVVLTLRENDLEILALTVGAEPDELRSRLLGAGALIAAEDADRPGEVDVEEDLIADADLDAGDV